MRACRSAIRLFAVGALAAGGAGCLFGGGRAEDPSAGAHPITAPEARRMLARSRELIEDDAGANAAQAVRLADSVIHNCATRRFVWEGFLVKAAAYAGAGDPAAAAGAAREGIRMILTLEPGPVDGTAWTAMKRLLPVYVENFVAARDGGAGRQQLDAWRQELLRRCAEDTPAARLRRDDIGQSFAVLVRMADRHAAGREIETQIDAAMTAYLSLYNAGRVDEAAGLLAPGPGRAAIVSRLAKRAAGGAAAPPRLYSAGELKIAVPVSDNASPLFATATCDLLATSRAGWARRVAGVEFHFARDDGGRWLITSVVGHP